MVIFRIFLPEVLGSSVAKKILSTTNHDKTLTFLNPTSTNSHRLACTFSEKCGMQILVQKYFFYVFFNIFSKTRVLNFAVFSVKLHRNLWLFVLVGLRKVLSLFFYHVLSRKRIPGHTRPQNFGQKNPKNDHF
jgi:hypothetical protein